MRSREYERYLENFSFENFDELINSIETGIGKCSEKLNQ